MLADNHDIISLKLYQLTVERTPEEERRDKEVYLPVVDNLKLPGSKWGSRGRNCGISPAKQLSSLKNSAALVRRMAMSCCAATEVSQLFLSPAVEAPLEPMSGLALFLIVFFSLVAIVFAIVIGVIVYNKWQEQSRKHFY